MLVSSCCDVILNRHVIDLNTNMDRGRGRGSGGRVGKSSLRCDSIGRANMPTIPIPTTVSPQQGGTSFIGGPDPINQVQTLRTPPVQASDIARGKGQGSPQQGGTSSIGGPDSINHVQTLGTPPVQASDHGSNPTIPELSPITPDLSGPVDEGTSKQSNTVSEEESSSRRRQRTLTLVTLTPAGLEPSKECSNTISASFKNQLDPNGINWKGVSEDTRNFYFGEFKTYHWDSSIPESVIKKHWNTKAATKYTNFISKIKQKRIKPDYVSDNVWERWLQLWPDPKCVEKSEINAKNRCGGKEVAAGTHTGGSICIGEHRKRLAVTKGRDPTPGEVHLHVHTHDHDGESFVDERARDVHERYQEILREKSQSQSDIDQCEAYYEAAGGTRKRRTYGLGSQAQSYYGPNLCVNFAFNASASTTPSTSQSAPTENMEELVMQLIPTLTDRLLPLFIEKARGVISSPSHHLNTPVDKPSVVTPIVLPPTTVNVDDVDPLVSDGDRSPSPMH
ncbi:uncharacterized protein LOC132617140 isoform X3 [Lycium barbarum]|uniref:uncharacterized protein LOC132617140 isoform X3 n=1 Tax=Lycium barbarum TaxID=112863 RepID=UPI00293E3C8A|nr:uncharacterized protein LOC132617140 isoform X3 [Lycium barbarum]